MKTILHYASVILAIGMVVSPAVAQDLPPARPAVAAKKAIVLDRGQVPGQYVRPLPNQVVRGLPGQVVRALPGQLVPLLPGQQVPALPGQIVRSLPGQLVQSLPGETDQRLAPIRRQ